MKHLTRIYVRRYRDNGQVTAYADWSDGSRTESQLRYFDRAHYEHRVITFGAYMHDLFARAKAGGLRMQRETWG